MEPLLTTKEAYAAMYLWMNPRSARQEGKR